MNGDGEDKQGSSHRTKQNWAVVSRPDVPKGMKLKKAKEKNF